MTEPVVLSWSGGKDSAMSLHVLKEARLYDVVALLTTVSEEYGRISHHGVRQELLEQQAAALELPLYTLAFPARCSNEQYERVMREAMLHYKARGITKLAFGDIFLQDLREYREARMAEVGMSAVFPIWGRDTTELVRRFINLGFVARLCCVDQAKLGETFAGRLIDEKLLRDLPEDVDPCGERGEYHSFVYGGPLFRRRLNITVGRTVLRDTRYFTDLLPQQQTEEGAHA